MFSALTVAILMSLGSSAWLYARVMKSTGGNTKNSLITAGIACVFMILVLTTILDYVFKHAK